MNAKLIDFESKTKDLTQGNYYWTFEKGLDSETCKTILDTATGHFNQVTILGKDGQDKTNENIRKGHNFFDNQQFVYDKIQLLNPTLKYLLTIEELVELFKTNRNYYINKNQS